MAHFINTYGPVARKLSANLILWAIFMVTFLILYIFKNGLSEDKNVPLDDINGLINWFTFTVLVISSMILFFIFSLNKHKSKDEIEKTRSTFYMDIALEECAGILFNFGSLIVVVTLYTNDWWYLCAAFISYIIGVLMYPKQ